MTHPNLVLALIPMLTRRARRLSSDRHAAEDLVQNTLLKLCQMRQRGRTIDDPTAYAMRILQNEARRGWRGTDTEELQHADVLTQPHALLRLVCADTPKAAAALPDPQRRLLEIVIEGETSPRAIAEQTGMPQGTVMSRLARARAKLRITLEHG